MKRFKFRLQRVLDFRERIRNERKEELQRRNYELQLLLEQLELLQREALEARILENAEYPVEHLSIIAQYQARLATEIANTELAIIKAKDLVEEAREAYIEASKDEKALVTLKDKRKQEYTEEVLKEEEKFLDEAAVQRYGRGR